MAQRIIAWDFDGVLNRNIVDGAFVWKANFDEDMGASVEDFSEFVFRSGRFSDVLIGKRDIKDIVAEWVETSNCDKTASEVLDYWFAKDALPDAETLKLLDRSRDLGWLNVIATNNEARRAAYIEQQMGFGDKIESVFAAGPMGCKKPDPTFFKTIETALDARPNDLMLIDDKEENVLAAKSLGWSGFYFRDGDHAGLEQALFG